MGGTDAIVRAILTMGLGLLALLILVGVFLWIVTSIKYRISSQYLKIMLFGLCIRRIPLRDIESVSKRRTGGLAEHWWNTLRPSHRILVIRRHRGLFKNVVITPRNRYVFRADLEKAMRLAAEREENAKTSDAAPI